MTKSTEGRGSSLGAHALALLRIVAALLVGGSWSLAGWRRKTGGG